jgi:uncharacterized protein (TIGR02145 family)
MKRFTIFFVLLLSINILFAQSTATLSLPNVEVGDPGEFAIPIELSAISANLITGFSVGFEFDETKIQWMGTTANPAAGISYINPALTPLGGDWWWNYNTQGTLGFEWYDPAYNGVSVAAPSNLIVFRFQYLGGLNPGESALLTFSVYNNNFYNENWEEYSLNLNDGSVTRQLGTALNLKMFLEGPFNGTSMNTDLNTQNLIPLNQPYNIEPWNYRGEEQVSSIPNGNIVDWVLVELLKPTIKGLKGFHVVERKAGFLLNNGTITNTDGISLLDFPYNNSPELFARIIHRNHVAVLSNDSLFFESGICNYDFTSDTAAVFGGSNAVTQLASGIWGMMAGEGNNDGQIDNLDKDEIWLLQQGLTGYLAGDYNLDGQVDAVDEIMMWEPNSGKGAMLPIRFMCGDFLIDQRDGKYYPTILIGQQCWMTKNLDLGNMIMGNINMMDNGLIEKYCYDNNIDNCNTFGGLYQWDEMMQYDTIEFSKGLCPEGWHLPNAAEWETLINYLGGSDSAGYFLSTNGSSGFDALMNGQYTSATGFNGQDNLSAFWTASNSSVVAADGYYIINGNPSINAISGSMTDAYGVRCLEGQPTRVNENVIVIDTNVYKMLSDSLELVQGTYRYEIIDNQKAKNIIAGNYIIGITEMGYLRKVDTANTSGNELTLITSQATFEDIFESCSLEWIPDTTSKSNLLFNSSSKVLYLADGVQINSKNGVPKFDFSGTVLYSSGGVSITITQGHVTLDPNFNRDFIEVEKWKVKRLAFYAENTLYETSMDVQLSVSSSSNGAKDKLLAKIESPGVFFIPTPIGPWPVTYVISTVLKSQVQFNFDAAFSSSIGYTNTNTLSFGVLYENDNWQNIWELNKSTCLHPLTWDGVLNLHQGFQIIPEISIRFYGIGGPYFNLPLTEDIDANFVLPELDFDARLDIGLSGNLGSAINIFGKTLSDYNKQIFGFTKNLYSTPTELIYISGNEQSGEKNTQLPDPLKVKVVDNLGHSYVPAMVHFFAETGGGSLSDEDVWTDENGNAQTYWTLGNFVGVQEIKAEVKKANGQNIEGSPLYFTAIADQGTPCPGTPTVTYEGQTYNTVQIGTQCWFKKNLNVGSMISGSYSQHNDTLKEKYCYNDNPANCATYGGLYQWNEMMQYSTTPGVKGICPTGWHLPTDAEWTTLTTFLGGAGVAGGKMKATGTIEAGTGLWYAPNFGATNESGFTALPGGRRGFLQLGEVAYFWSSSQNTGNNEAWYRALNYMETDVIRNDTHKVYGGCSVRCLKN